MSNGVLTVATLNLEDGRELDPLPDLAGQVADIDILSVLFSGCSEFEVCSDLVLCDADMFVTCEVLPDWPGRPARSGDAR